MSLWMGLGWDEMLKSIPQRNATQRPLAGPVPFVVRGTRTRMHKPSISHTQRSIIQRPRQARSSLHSTPYRDALYYPTPAGLLRYSLYLTVLEASGDGSLPSRWAMAEAIADGQSEWAEILDITMSVFARSDLFVTKGERVFVAGTHA
ncbi:hypothetical protein JMJ77_0008888 [Colletotrichum scovillei]|uniref:Uncharacterized protein n=1 Tax=Colletotrichum scovillei TaxID=1209932 RepID=A0A9P7U868_9PEZI|nr:hypothetical protein JMJ77_0008888 [Colletotrichum scovillei]KAG7061216.1 hypothetical protein JMJ76_0010285 [Colletotrichum scovillei]